MAGEAEQGAGNCPVSSGDWFIKLDSQIGGGKLLAKGHLPFGSAPGNSLLKSHYVCNRARKKWTSIIFFLCEAFMAVLVEKIMGFFSNEVFFQKR